MMNKLFYFLLFCSVSGAAVLWWLMNATSPQEESTQVSSIEEIYSGLIIEDDEYEDVEDVEVVELKDEGLETVEAYDSNDRLEESEPQSGDSLFAEQEVAQPSTLMIVSEPSGAVVYREGRRVGVTPFEGELSSESLRFRLEKEGFEPVERTAEAEPVPQGGLVNWRITMVPQELPPAERSRLEDVSAYFLRGMSGPYFVQVRSVNTALKSRAQMAAEILRLRDEIREERIFACEVSLGERGDWFRIVIGPFRERSEARQAIPFLRQSLNVDDLFATGAQTCR